MVLRGSYSLREFMHRRSGFTFVEIIVVVVVGTILVSMALRGFGTTTSRIAAESARQDFAALQARARAHAIERGETVRFRADPAGDSAWIEASAGRIDFVDFDQTRDVGLTADVSGVVTLCMNPRGFAETTCNSFGSGTVTFEFMQGAQRAELTMLPLGQLRW